MNEYDISYQITNNYKEPVTEAIYEFMVLPCNDDSQITVDFTFDNSLGETVFHYRNMFGFQVTRIRTEKSFDKMMFNLKARVRKRNAISNHSTSTSSPDEKNIIASPDFYMDNYLYLKQSPYTVLTEKYSTLLLKKAETQSVSEYLQELNSYVSGLIVYDKTITKVETDLEHVLDSKKGISGDFAHLFISFCRSNGIPARFVSGYLNKSSHTTMHNWAEALVPGYGWVGYDPAGKSKVDANYIKVAHGVDYRDCSPIKGIIKTNAENHHSFHKVEVVSQQ